MDKSQPYLSVVTPATTQEVARVGPRGGFVAEASLRAKDALFAISDAVVGRLVDVHQFVLACQETTLAAATAFPPTGRVAPPEPTPLLPLVLKC